MPRGILTQAGLLLACALAALCRPGDAALNMNCTAAGVTGTDCMTHMRLALASFVLEERAYSSRNIPVKDPSEAIDVGGFVTFFHLSDVNQVEGRVAMNIYIDLFWKDYYIQWDPQWTDGIDYLFIDPDLLWKPDIQLYNTIGVYEETMDQTAQLWIEYDNDVWWSRPGAINAACIFDLRDFPFDSQSCNITFGSFMYDVLMLNLTFYEYEDLGNTVIRDGFKSLTWKVDSIQGYQQNEVIYGYDFTLLTWTMHLTRYYQYYVSNAILPSLCVTFISLGALWIPDVQSRLGLAVTALLTIVAVQWTVSATLPVTETTTWLAEFSNLCILYVALICGECCMVSYMGSKKGKPPKWVKLTIILSNVVKVTRKYIYVTVQSYMWWKKKRRKSQDEDVRSPMADDVVSVELAAMNRETMSALTSLPRRSSAHMGGVDSDDEEDHADARPSQDCGVPHQRKPRGRSASQASEIGRFSVSDSDAAAPETPKEPKYSWERGARAVDRLTRVTLPISFVVILLLSYYT